MEDIAQRGTLLGVDTSLDMDAIAEISRYFNWICVREGKPRGCVVEYDPALYSHEVPGA